LRDERALGRLDSGKVTLITVCSLRSRGAAS
jgi:hypothetical protein